MMNPRNGALFHLHCSYVRGNQWFWWIVRDKPQGTLCTLLYHVCLYLCLQGLCQKVKISRRVVQGYYLVGGWATPLKNMKVNWDDEIPNIWENKKWQPNHQPAINHGISGSITGLFLWINPMIPTDLYKNTLG